MTGAAAAAAAGHRGSDLSGWARKRVTDDAHHPNTLDLDLSRSSIMMARPLVPTTILCRIVAAIIVAAATAATAATAAASGGILGGGLRLEEARAALGSALAATSSPSPSSSSALAGAPFADKVFHGTTTCAFVFDNGILVAVDSRASMGTSGGVCVRWKMEPPTTHPFHVDTPPPLFTHATTRGPTIAPQIPHSTPPPPQEATLGRARPRRCCR